MFVSHFVLKDTTLTLFLNRVNLAWLAARLVLQPLLALNASPL